MTALNVRDFGAVGDGNTDDTAAIQAALDEAYGTAEAPHGGLIDVGADIYSNRPVFFPAGYYKITSPLTLRSVRGAHIFGAGRFTTYINNTATDGSVFVTNGCDYSVFERMSFGCVAGTGKCFDLNWDGTGSTALQSNTFRDISFGGGAYGLCIGADGYMGSENTIQNCYFGGHGVAGLSTQNYNALQQSVTGGNFASCRIGIWVASGSVPLIHGVGFQNQTDADIAVDNSCNDSYSIVGCRNENVYDNNTTFARIHAGAATHISGCVQLATGTGTTFLFAEQGPPPAGTGAFCIDSCYSSTGKITGNGTLYIRGNAGGIAFGNPEYLASFAGTVVQNS